MMENDNLATATEEKVAEKERRAIRCDEVQHPPAGSFTSEALEWFCCQKQGRRTSYLEAWINMDRLQDFIKGESSRPEFQCNFKIKKTEVKKGRMTRSYWCSYGPEDERKIVLQDWASAQAEIKKSGARRGLGSRPKRMTVNVGLSVRRGCRCHFNIITDTNREDIVMISWVEQRHVDVNGQFCHGLLCEDSRLANIHMAPKLSRDCVLHVERLLRSGVPSSEILAEHRKLIADVVRKEENGEEIQWTRDMHLSAADITNIQARLRKEGHVYHHDDATAVRQWTQRFPEYVIDYQEQSREADRPFRLVFCTPWMLKTLALHGQGKAICLDATHGTNRYGFQLFTWMVYDKCQNGIPVVWALLERHRAEDLIRVQEKIKEKVESSHADMLRRSFEPSCFLTDDSAEEKASIRSVYPGTPVDLCIWHVRCSWNKNLTTKVHHAVHRAMMNKELGNLMYSSHPDPSELCNAFIKRWRTSEPKFIDYFEEHWVPKLKEWVLTYRTHERANQNTTGAVERWHALLKANIRGSSYKKTQRTICWLLVMLTEKIELSYWCSAQLKLQGRTRNRIVEEQVVSVCMKARNIADSDIQTVETNGIVVRICQSQKTPRVFYTVTDWGTEKSNCSCSHHSLGNLCKHEVKALLMDGVSETDIVIYLGRKYGSEVGSLVQLQANNTEENSASEADFNQESLFHFPFADQQEIPMIDTEAKVSVDTVTNLIKHFDSKVQGDSFYLSHLLIRVKESIKEVLNMKSKDEANTGLHENLNRVVTPLEFGGQDAQSANLDRMKGWFEKLQSGKRRPRGQLTINEAPEDGPAAFEKVTQTPWLSFDKQFDEAALKELLGGQDHVEAGKKKRKRTVASRPKIGSSVRKPPAIKLGKKRQTIGKENIDPELMQAVARQNIDLNVATNL